MLWHGGGSSAVPPTQTSPLCVPKCGQTPTYVHSVLLTFSIACQLSSQPRYEWKEEEVSDRHSNCEKRMSAKLSPHRPSCVIFQPLSISVVANKRTSDANHCTDVAKKKANITRYLFGEQWAKSTRRVERAKELRELHNSIHDAYLVSFSLAEEYVTAINSISRAETW